jgi:HSP20 family protein
MWSPSRQLERLRDEMDKLMERFGLNGDWAKQLIAPSRRPPIESVVEGNTLVIRADLPGIDPKNVEVTVAGNTLNIRGSREEKHETKKPNFIRRELSYGSFERSIELPQGIKADDLKATYNDGVLELTAAMPKELSAKEVKVQIGNGVTKKNRANEHKQK